MVSVSLTGEYHTHPLSNLSTGNCSATDRHYVSLRLPLKPNEPSASGFTPTGAGACAVPVVPRNIAASRIKSAPAFFVRQPFPAYCLSTRKSPGLSGRGFFSPLREGCYVLPVWR